jgi:hypothetical protein
VLGKAVSRAKLASEGAPFLPASEARRSSNSQAKDAVSRSCSSLLITRARNSMNYKRRDLVAKDGTIITPDFEFSITCEQDRDNPSSALITRQLVNISPTIIENEAFNEVFNDYFDELTFDFDKPVNIKNLIDRIEDLDSDKIHVEYPSDCSHCSIEIDDSPFEIRVARHSLTVQTPRPTSPKLLVETFFDAQKKLSGTPVIRAIAPSSI